MMLRMLCSAVGFSVVVTALGSHNGPALLLGFVIVLGSWTYKS